jgi:hypothetical protein
VNVGRAFIAGVIGAVVMEVVMLLLRVAGVPLHIEMRLAAALGSQIWLIGLVMHLLIGGVIGIVYAVVFEWILNSSGVGQGVLLGAINTIFAGFVWALFSRPGAFWSTLGPVGIAALFLVHFVYGGVVGGLYKIEHTRAYY